MTITSRPLVAIFCLFLLNMAAGEFTVPIDIEGTTTEAPTTEDVSHHVFCPQSYGLLDPLEAIRYATTRNCSIGMPREPASVPVENQRRQVLEEMAGLEIIHYYCPFRTFFCDGVWVNGSKMANATAMGCYSFKTIGMVTNYTLSTCHCEPQEGKEPLLVEPIDPSLPAVAEHYKKNWTTCGWKIQLRKEDVMSEDDPSPTNYSARHGTSGWLTAGMVAGLLMMSLNY
ncbi:unnamed protein product, partial [Mesorhabditis spiculigera]